MGKKKRKTPLELGKRERQIFETVMELGEASVAEVLAKLDNPPSYSAVRATMGLLVDKGWLRFRREGQRYLYRPAAGQEKARRNAAERMLSTYFGGSAMDAVAALLDISAQDLSDEQLQQIIQMIEQARQENR